MPSTEILFSIRWTLVSSVVSSRSDGLHAEDPAETYRGVSRGSAESAGLVPAAPQFGETCRGVSVMNAMKSGGTRGIRTSVIISVLESYAVVRAQCRHLSRILPADWELILLDDGSQPPIEFPEWRPANFTLVHTRNFHPWTQPIARNLGGRLACGKFRFQNKSNAQRQCVSGRDVRL